MDRSDAPLLIGIAGGSGCGKTYLANRVCELAGADKVGVISMDQYFRTEARAASEHINFDHPGHLDLDLMIAHLERLRAGQSVRIPRYDFRSMKQVQEATPIEPLPVLLVEGLFVLAQPVVDSFDLTCFLDVDADQRLLGRILRDLHERNARIEQTVDRYQRFVRPSYHVFIAPTKQNADIVVDFTYRRSLFTRLLAELVSDFVAKRLDVADFVQSVRGESYRLGYRPQESVMPMAVDIRQLAAAYPEHAVPPAVPLKPEARLFLEDGKQREG